MQIYSIVYYFCLCVTSLNFPISQIKLASNYRFTNIITLQFLMLHSVTRITSSVLVLHVVRLMQESIEKLKTDRLQNCNP